MRAVSINYPVAGLTVVHFPNNHLVYALTWFGLALMTLLGARIALRQPSESPQR
jgi:surfeit locus 1 family protein